jgi:hypothetical protein
MKRAALQAVVVGFDRYGVPLASLEEAVSGLRELTASTEDTPRTS